MTIKELVDKLAERTEITKKDAETQVKALGEIILDTLENGEEVTLFDLGKLKVKEVAERKALKNPRNVEEGYQTIPAHKAVKYSASKKVKELFK